MEEDYTRSTMPRVRKDVRKIQIGRFSPNPRRVDRIINPAVLFRYEVR
jgi:hypothetical protein